MEHNNIKDLEEQKYVDDLNSLLNELPDDQRAYIKKTIEDYRNMIQTNIVDNLVLLLSINNDKE